MFLSYLVMITLAASVIALPTGKSSLQTLNQGGLVNQLAVRSWKAVQPSSKHPDIPHPTINSEHPAEKPAAYLRKRSNPPDENTGPQRRRRRSDLSDEEVLDTLTVEEQHFLIDWIDAKVRFILFNYRDLELNFLPTHQIKSHGFRADQRAPHECLNQLRARIRLEESVFGNEGGDDPSTNRFSLLGSCWCGQYWYKSPWSSAN